MASLDLGTLVARIKTEGVEQAKAAFKGVGNAAATAGNAAGSSTSGFKSLKDSFVNGIGSTSMFGSSLGTLGGALGSTEAMAGILGGVMAGVVVAGLFAAFEMVKRLTQAFIDLIKETFTLGVNFQATMSKVKALSGATAGEFDTLTKGAMEFGSASVFSATESAEAMTYMAQAGWDTTQIMSGMSGVLSLAASSGEGLATTSDIVTTSLNAFGEAADQSGRLADILAVAANETTTNVQGLGEALKYAAPVSGALKMSMEDTAIALGLMANSGVDASMSGTALRSTLTNLAKPTKKMKEAMDTYGISLVDANGNVKSLGGVMDNFRSSMVGVGDAEKTAAIATIAGKEAMSGLLAIVNASDESYNKLTKSIYNSSGASGAMAKTMTDNIKGLQEAISGKMETIKLSIFSIFEPLVSGVLKIYDAFLGVTEKLWSSLGGMLSKITGLITPFVDTFVGIFSAIFEILGPIIEPFFLLIEAGLGKQMEGLKLLGDVVMSVVTAIKDALMPLVDFINNVLMIAVDLMSGNFESAFNRVELLAGQFADAVCSFFLLIPNAIVAVINTITTKINEYFGTNIAQIDKFETHFADGAKRAVDTAEKSADAMVKLQEDAQNQLMGLDKVYDTYMDNKMAKWEKSIEGRYNMESLQGIKLYEQAKARKEEEFQRTIDVDRKTQESRMAFKEQALAREVSAEQKAQKEMQKAGEDNYKKQASWLDSLADMWSNLFSDKKSSKSSQTMDAHANGTINSRGGYALVGEFRPEIVKLNPGDSVRQIDNNTFGGMDTSKVVDAISSLAAKVDGVISATRNITREQKNNEYMGMVRG